MVDSQKRFDEMKSTLREHGFRLTPQRVALLRVLSASCEHPRACELYAEIQERFPTTSLATVYKTLNLLKEVGELLELGFSHDDNRYDGRRPDPHPHVVCVECRKILDVEMTPSLGLEQKASQHSDYRIVGHRLDFYGVCPDCRSEGRDT